VVSYVLLIVIGALGMAVLDGDPTSVSLEEWAIYAVMLYSTWKLIQRMIDLIRENGEGL
jgi:hypothetical protein